MSDPQTPPAQAEKIRLLADSEIYSKAITFADKQSAITITNHQLAGLRQFSRSWDELIRFVHHQFVRHQKNFVRHQKNKDCYHDFYNALHTDLQALRARVRDEFVPANLTKQETKSRVDHFAGQLAHAFIQHLVAEIEWRQKKERP